MDLTRRSFITHIGQLGGYRAAFSMMRILDLIPDVGLAAGPLGVAPLLVPGHGTEVVVLGAGIAGLVSAWELRQAGYSVTLLEARRRPGGRNWTIRGGDRVEFTDGTVQRCRFGEGHYFNAGPARLPSTHTGILGYCRQFGVPLEVEINTSRGTLMQADQLNGGQPVAQRQVVNDTRGHVAELLAKAVNGSALDSEITGDDKARMLAFLRLYGDLTPDYRFRGSQRSGVKGPQLSPQTGEKPITVDPLDMHALLDANLWDSMLAEEVLDWQATMLQPVGGMDRIPAAFAARLGPAIRYGADVKQIRQSPDGIRVVYQDREHGTHVTINAHYCICTLPLPVLGALDTDCAPDFVQAVTSCSYDSAYKIAWESRRFWEQQYNIYGGLSYLKQPVGIVWYPSAGLFSDRGVILSGYAIENDVPEFANLTTIDAKLDASRGSVERLHPGHGRELENPVYVSWGRIPYSVGSWISYKHAPPPQVYERLTAPDGRLFLAGDHTTHLVGWQEGAVRSAYRAINNIGAHLRANAPTPA
jgi:monoamine oxidase